MSEIERNLVGIAADLTRMLSEIASTQEEMAILLARHLPALPEADRREFLSQTVRVQFGLHEIRSRTEVLRGFVGQGAQPAEGPDGLSALQLTGLRYLAGSSGGDRSSSSAAVAPAGGRVS